MVLAYWNLCVFALPDQDKTCLTLVTSHIACFFSVALSIIKDKLYYATIKHMSKSSNVTAIQISTLVSNTLLPPGPEEGGVPDH